MKRSIAVFRAKIPFRAHSFQRQTVVFGAQFACVAVTQRSASHRFPCARARHAVCSAVLEEAQRVERLDGKTRRCSGWLLLWSLLCCLLSRTSSVRAQTHASSGSTTVPAGVPSNAALTPAATTSHAWIPEQNTADVYLITGFNPLAGALLGGLRHRWNERPSDNILLDGRRLEVGFETNLNPAFLMGGVYAEWIPLAPLVLRLQYDMYGYLGTYGGILGVQERSLPYGDELRDHNPGRLGFVQRALARVTLRGRIWRVVVQSENEFAGYQLSGTEPYWIDLEHDLLLAQREFFIKSHNDLFFEVWKGHGEQGLMVGPYYEVATGLVSGARRQRLGGLAVLTFTEQWRVFHNPRLFAILSWHLEDRNRLNGLYGLFGIGSDFRW